jgi:hypothetical protein
MRISPLITAIIVLTPYTARAANRSCTLPAILHVSRPGSDLIYQVNDHTPHRLFTLGEVSDAIRDCKSERILFVVASPEVPVGSLVVPSQEQIEHVRYFVQFAVNDFWEVGTDHYFVFLPVTPDILPEPLYDDTPPPAASKPKGNK